MAGGTPLTLRRLLISLAMLLAVLGIVALTAAGFGAGRASLTTLWSNGSPEDEIARTILFEVRLPRIALAGVLGGALTVAGLVFQALLRNPLARSRLWATPNSETPRPEPPGRYWVKRHQES